jgi:osmoprotectant transport system substrate-binding protein/osmoprotectant transport system permease protein
MKKILTLLPVIALVLSVAACGSSKKDSEIIMYDGTYAEPSLIVCMIKLLVEENTDATVTIKDQMSAVNVFNEMKKGEVYLMNSYDGTVLTTFLKYDPVDVEAGMTLYEFANMKANEELGMSLLDKLGHENTYALGVRREIVQQYNLKTISDLVAVAPELVFGGEHEFFSQEGSMKFGPFTEFYGLKFKNNVSVDISLKYAGIENNNYQVTDVYSTDGLNKKADLVILEDDRNFFPEYNDCLFVRNDIFEKYKDAAPNLKEVLNMLAGQTSDEIMTDLTYAVDVEERPVAEVAKEFLQSRGLIK